MSRSVVGRLGALVLAVATVGVVGALAYQFGVDHADRFRPMVLGANLRDSDFEPGWWLLGLVALGLVAMFIFWLVADRLSKANDTVASDMAAAPLLDSSPSVEPDAITTAVPVTPDLDVDRLRKLADLHTIGKLTDEEFTAAKRKVLGL